MKNKKIVNDPVYGFIRIPSTLVFDLIEHPYFQRLRYIKQLGMTHLVYPGALHTRFHHALGAMHLMQLALETLKVKGQEISPEEEEAAIIAILLHDIGHGPFSHALEYSIVEGVVHEHLSNLFMQKLNQEFDHKLDLAIQIFNNQYHRKFFHQLVSSQLDLDRLDYLNRDSFFTGVAEGVVGFDRIIAMLNVADGELVIEEKGIYSVEKFLIARRLMYWQVYFHKTVLAAEQMLVKALQRAKDLSKQGEPLFATSSLQHFLAQNLSYDDFLTNDAHLAKFARLDDNDIFTSIKAWSDNSDFILSRLCKNLIDRKLYHIEIGTQLFDSALSSAESKLHQLFSGKVLDEEKRYFLFTDTIQNRAYKVDNVNNIKVLKKNGNVVDLATASDNADLGILPQIVQKHFMCIDRALM